MRLNGWKDLWMLKKTVNSVHFYLNKWSFNAKESNSIIRKFYYTATFVSLLGREVRKSNRLGSLYCIWYKSLRRREPRTCLQIVHILESDKSRSIADLFCVLSNRSNRVVESVELYSTVIETSISIWPIGKLTLWEKLGDGWTMIIKTRTNNRLEWGRCIGLAKWESFQTPIVHVVCRPQFRVIHSSMQDVIDSRQAHS